MRQDGTWMAGNRDDIEHIRQFTGSDIRRRWCYVRLEVLPNQQKIVDEGVLQVLKRLTGFEIVYFQPP